MFFRWMFGLPGAALISALLFLGMAYMIRQEAGTTIVDPPPPIEFLAKLEPTRPDKPRTIDHTPVEPPKPIDIEFPDRIDNPGRTIPTERPPGPNREGGPIVLPGPMQPTVKPPPSYPETCRSRGAQGIVIVEFDVTAEGAVVNPRIISSADGCFDRTVLQTIQKYKYPPPPQDGRPVARRGVREVFNFQLEG